MPDASITCTRSASQKPRLTTLPYDVLFKILSLVLPILPPRVALALDRPGPPWLDMFTLYRPIRCCPSILLVCRLLTRHCLRMIYTHTRLSIHAGRSYLARLSGLRARRYVQKLDLALERQLRPNSKQKHEILLRHDSSSLDMVSFYSPAYLVDLLHRIFPRLRSIHLTIVETGGFDNSPDGKRMDRNGSGVPVDAEPVHYFALAAFTQSMNIDPAMWNNLITAIRYKRSNRPEVSLAERFKLLRRRDPEIITNEPEKASNKRSVPTLGTSVLPNLSQVQLYLTTSRSYADDTTSRNATPWMEQQQLEKHFRALSRMMDLSRKGVEVSLRRITIYGGPGERRETGWEQMEQHHLDALLQGSGEAKGKGKQWVFEDQVDETW